jgi:Spy/CpxP family protein refolding chaperone
MITRYLAAGLVLAGLLLSQTWTAPRAEAGGRAKWWNAPRVQKELRLSRGEKRRLEQMNLDMRRRLIKLRSTIQDRRIMLDNLLSRDSVNEKKVRKLNQEISRAQAEISRVRSRFVVEVRKLLGPKRFQKLRGIFRSLK